MSTQFNPRAPRGMRQMLDKRSWRTKVSASLTYIRPIKIEAPSKRAKFYRYTLATAKSFDPASFRTVTLGERGTKGVIGCPKGSRRKPNWDAKKKKCGVGTHMQAVLVPRDRVDKIFARYMKRRPKVAANPLNEKELRAVAKEANKLAKTTKKWIDRAAKKGALMPASLRVANLWHNKLDGLLRGVEAAIMANDPNKYQKALEKMRTLMTRFDGIHWDNFQRLSQLEFGDVFKSNPNDEDVFIGPLKKGGLYGWHSTMAAPSRRLILVKAVKKDGYATIIRRLNALRVLNRNKKSGATYKSATSDMHYLQKKYREPEQRRRVAANPGRTLTKSQIQKYKKQMVQNGVPVRFLDNGQAVDISTGERHPKGTNVMYHPVYWNFTKETARDIAKDLGVKAVFSKGNPGSAANPLTVQEADSLMTAARAGYYKIGNDIEAIGEGRASESGIKRLSQENEKIALRMTGMKDAADVLTKTAKTNTERMHARHVSEQIQEYIDEVKKWWRDVVPGATRRNQHIAKWRYVWLDSKGKVQRSKSVPDHSDWILLPPKVWERSDREVAAHLRKMGVGYAANPLLMTVMGFNPHGEDNREYGDDPEAAWRARANDEGRPPAMGNPLNRREVAAVKRMERAAHHDAEVARSHGLSNQLAYFQGLSTGHMLVRDKFTERKRPKRRGRRNPGGTVQKPTRRNPAQAVPVGKQIPFQEFYAWAKKSLDPNLLSRLNSAIKRYQQFHDGATPNSVSRELVKGLGGDGQVMTDFVFSMGRSPTETYIPPDGSGKGRYTYLHEYGNGDESLMPENFTTVEGNFVGKVLKGKTHVSDWIHD